MGDDRVGRWREREVRRSSGGGLSSMIAEIC